LGLLLAVSLLWATSPGYGQNSPNPFREHTTIAFALPENAKVALTVLDRMGKTVLQPINGKYGAGNHQAQIPAGSLAPGLYLYLMKVETAHGANTLSRKMTVSER